MSRIAVYVAGVVASLTVVALFWERTDTDGLTVAYLVATGFCSVFLLLAVRSVPEDRRGPWTWILTNMGLCQVGETVLAGYELTGSDAWPTPADGFFIAATFATAIGVLGLNRQRGRRPAFGAVLDALIVTVGVGVLVVVFLILPLAWDTDQPVLGKVVATVYPLLDVLLLFLLLRTLAGGRPPATFVWVAASMLCTLTADTAQNVIELVRGGSGFPVWMNVVWACAYLFMGFAAASAYREEGPGPAAVDVGLTVPRLAGLALGAGLPSAVVIGRSVAGQYRGAIWLGLGSLVLLAMVVTRIWDLLQQVRRQSDEMAAMARTDPLTRIANRRSWDFDLARAMAVSLRDGTHLLVALLDLDHFKQFNDSRGHQAGDDLLREAAAAWREALRPEPVIARWGGEEFAAFVHCADVEDGRARLDGLRRVVPHGQSVSIGIARWDGTEDAARLLRRADEALYEAKSTGRNRSVTSFAPVSSERSSVPHEVEEPR